MPNTMPQPFSEIIRDNTLTPEERLHMTEGLFVHDAVGQLRDERTAVAPVARAPRIAPRARSTRGTSRENARESRH